MSTVDTLEVQIQSKADSVNSSLDNVVKKLGLIAEGISAIGKNSGLEQFAKEAREATKGFASISNAAKGISANVKPQVQEVSKTLGELTEKYKDLGKGFKITGSTAAIQKQLESYSNALEKAKLKKDELEIGGKIGGQAYEDAIRDTVKFQNIITSLKNQLESLNNTKATADIKINGGENAGKFIIEYKKELADFKADMKSIGDVYGGLGNAPKGMLDTPIENLKISLGELKASYPQATEIISAYEKELQNLQTISSGLTREPVRLDIDTSAFGKINENAQKLSELGEKLKQLQVPEIREENLDKLRSSLEKTEIKLDELRTKLENGLTMGHITESADDSGFVRLQEQIALTEKQAEALRAKIANVESQSGNNKGLEGFRATLLKISNAGKASASALDKVASATKKIGSLAGGAVSKVAGLGKAFSRTKKSSNAMNFSLAGGFKTFLKYGLGIRSVYVLIGRLRRAIIEGFGNLAQYSSETNGSISMLMSSLTMLKNAFAVAFAPILNVVAPYLSTFINMVSTAANKVGQFFAALTGKSMAVQAVPVVQDYAAGLDKATGGTDKLNDSSKKLKKTLSVLGFDTLNQLQGQNDSGDSGGSSSGASAGGGLSAQDMFTTVPIENEISDFAKKVKSIFSQLFAPLKESWSNEGKFVIDSCKFALGEIGSLAKDVGRDFLEMWQQPETVGIFEDLLHIMGDIGLVTGNIASGLKDAWNTNSVGLQIFENIRDIVAIIVGHIRNAADYTVIWSESLDFYPLLESVNGLLEAVAPLTDTIGAGLEWFYTNVLLPVAGWTIQEAIPTFLDMVSAAISALNDVIVALQPLGQWLWENFLQPLGQWAGDTIISAMESITGLLGDFGNWVSEHQEAVQNITIVVASFFAAFKITTAIAGIVDFIAKIGSLIGSVGGMGKLIGTVFNPWTLAIGAVIAAGVLLWKHWDEISAKAKQVWEFVRQKFQEFDNFLQGVFTNDWTRSFGVVGEVFNAFFRNISNIWNSIKQVFGGIITFVKGVFTGDWRAAWDGIKQVFSGIWNGLVSIAKSPINAIIGMANGLLSGMASAVNGIANMLNSLRIDIPDWVPGIGGGTLGFNLPHWNPGRIPYLYNGGVLERGQVGILEGNGAEAVVPLERNRKWISKVSEEMARSNYAYSGDGIVGGMSKEELQEAIATGVAMALMSNINHLKPEMPQYIQANMAVDGDTILRAMLKAQDGYDYRMNPTPQYG